MLSMLPPVAVSAQQKSKKAPPPVPELNQKVVDFSRGQVGKKVGTGECTGLISAALREAGAVIPDNRPLGYDGDYAWGKQVATLTAEKHSVNDILPGDILQFRNVRTYSAIVRGGKFHTRSREFAHHTAVVLAVSGRDLRVLHSNIKSADDTEAQKELVREDTLALSDMKRGTIWVYRPMGAPDPKRDDADSGASGDDK
jgi:hypothetical protein